MKTRSKLSIYKEWNQFGLKDLKWWQRIVLFFVPTFRVVDESKQGKAVVWMKYYLNKYYVTGIDYAINKEEKKETKKK